MSRITRGQRSIGLALLTVLILGSSVDRSMSLELTAPQPEILQAVRSAPAATHSSSPTRPPIRSRQACPSQLETLVPLLLRDLPSYTNRVSQRIVSRYRRPDQPVYMIAAERADYQPLTLGPGSYQPTGSSDPPQVFFTTLEREYVSGKPVQLQHFHWLFLTETQQGWKLVLMVSALKNARSDEPPTPPEDSSNGVIAQAIRLWLRDCEAESVAP